jgi:hypothetical protein
MTPVHTCEGTAIRRRFRRKLAVAASYGGCTSQAMCWPKALAAP